MSYERFFPAGVRAALQYEPPGAWMPQLPPDCIRLSAGYPFPESIPGQEIAAAAARLDAAEGAIPFQYRGSPSMDRLPELARARLGARGMAISPDQLLITAGGCQAIDLAARVLLGPGDHVGVEAPTYMEALEIFRNYTPEIKAYPVDLDGLQVDLLAADLEGRRRAGLPTIKLLYTIASFQNPTGATLSRERRERLLSLAEQYDFLILEDDAYGELSFGPPPAPLLQLDQHGRVIHIGSLSKVVAPGLRIGWAAGPSPLMRAMALYMKDLDHSFANAVMTQYLQQIDLDARIATLREAYRHRSAVMLDALARQMPENVRWAEPGGGFFVWVHTPGIDTGGLLPRALAAGVAYVPGRHFYFHPGGGREYLRLSFSYLPHEEIERGIAILGRLLSRS